MTLSELAKMRRLRARPAFPVVMTDDRRVHVFCVENDLPVLWSPGIAEQDDLSPLHGLPVWVIASGQYQSLVERVMEHRPESMWVCGAYGFAGRIHEAVGRAVLWN